MKAIIFFYKQNDKTRWYYIYIYSFQLLLKLKVDIKMQMMCQKGRSDRRETNNESIDRNIEASKQLMNPRYDWDSHEIRIDYYLYFFNRLSVVERTQGLRKFRFCNDCPTLVFRPRKLGC